MNISRRTLALALSALMLVLATGVGIFMYRHRRVSSTDSYFTQLSEGRVNEDVRRTLELLQPFLDADPDNFTTLEDLPGEAHKYSIAFTTYALANIAVIEPNRRPEIARWIDKLIRRMVYESVWKDWRTQGWGMDPLYPNNIMWKGHLNLMYALHLLVSGEDKYEGCFHRLSQDIADGMRHKDIPAKEFVGALCENINYYFQCNTVSMLALRFHDQMYGTRYRTVEAEWLKWARENMVVKPSDLIEDEEKARKVRLSLKQDNVGLFYGVHHPLTNIPEKRMSGYTNAWAVTFLNFFDPDWAQQVYQSYRKTFITGIWRFAYSEEVPDRGIDGLATLFALFAAKEFEDRELFDRLMNVLILAGREKFDSANPEFAGVGTLDVDFATSAALQGALLFGKTNIGVRKLFEQARPLQHGANCKVCVLDAEFAKYGISFERVTQ